MSRHRTLLLVVLIALAPTAVSAADPAPGSGARGVWNRVVRAVTPKRRLEVKDYYARLAKERAARLDRGLAEVEKQLPQLQEQLTRAQNVPRWAPADLAPQGIARVLAPMRQGLYFARRDLHRLDVERGVPEQLRPRLAAVMESLSTLEQAGWKLAALKPGPAPKVARHKPVAISSGIKLPDGTYPTPSKQDVTVVTKNHPTNGSLETLREAYHSTRDSVWRAAKGYVIEDQVRAAFDDATVVGSAALEQPNARSQFDSSRAAGDNGRKTWSATRHISANGVGSELSFRSGSWVTGRRVDADGRAWLLKAGKGKDDGSLVIIRERVYPRGGKPRWTQRFITRETPQKDGSHLVEEIEEVHGPKAVAPKISSRIVTAAELKGAILLGN